jgi:hypothetical protein
LSLITDSYRGPLKGHVLLRRDLSFSLAEGEGGRGEIHHRHRGFHHAKNGGFSTIGEILRVRHNPLTVWESVPSGKSVVIKVSKIFEKFAPQFPG